MKNDKIHKIRSHWLTLNHFEMWINQLLKCVKPASRNINKKCSQIKIKRFKIQIVAIATYLKLTQGIINQQAMFGDFKLLDGYQKYYVKISCSRTQASFKVVWQFTGSVK